ncbi:MAG: Crp/Fnr family transcriptional regulator [Gemmatimonadota bacterium]|nr:Crp/Fnr family transcriptional regulator [Gemmatimonadota bacterium]
MNPRRVVDRVLYFRGHPAFAGLALEHLLSLARQCTSATLETGQRTPRASNPDLDTVLFVTAGGLEIESGDRVRTIRAGESAGLMRVLANRAPLSGRAIGPTEAIGLTREDLEEILENRFEIALAMLGWVCRESLDRMATLAPGHVLHGSEQETATPPPVGSAFARRLAGLARSSWFPGEHLDALAELAVHVQDVEMEPGHRLWTPGDAADHFFVITSGMVKCSAGLSWHCHGGEGVTVGEFEALSGASRRFEAEAEVPVSALRVDTGPFLDILEDHSQMAVDVLATLADRCLYLSGEGGTPP